MTQLKSSKQEEFPLIWEKVSLLFYSGLQQIGWGLLTLGKEISFTRFIDLNIKFIQKTLSQKCL